MRQVLVVLLLLPAAVLAADSPYLMIQPEHLSALLGGSVEIPFRFSHAWELAPDPQVKLSWRWKSFYGEFIYNSTPPFIHKQFKDRLVLIIAEDGVSGSLSISNLHKRDGTTYFCCVHLKTKQHGEKQWQSIMGTKLTITKAIKPTTQTKTTTKRSTSVISEVSSASFTVAQSQPLNLGAVVGVAVSTAIIKIGVLGLLALLRWRRKASQPQPKPQQGRDMRRNIKILARKDSTQSPHRDPRTRALSMQCSTSPAHPHPECLAALLSMPAPVGSDPVLRAKTR